MDPRDALPHVHRAVRRVTGQVRRSNVDRRKCCQLSADDGRLFVALRSQICRTKLTARCDDRREVVEFCKSRV